MQSTNFSGGVLFGAGPVSNAVRARMDAEGAEYAEKNGVKEVKVLLDDRDSEMSRLFGRTSFSTTNVSAEDAKHKYWLNLMDNSIKPYVTETASTETFRIRPGVANGGFTAV